MDQFILSEKFQDHFLYLLQLGNHSFLLVLNLWRDIDQLGLRPSYVIADGWVPKIECLLLTKTY